MFDCEADWFSTTLLEGQVMKDVKRKKKCVFCTLVVLLFKLAVYVS